MPRTKDVRGDNVFDSRDAIARRDELKEDRENLLSDIETAESDVSDCETLGEDDAARKDAADRLGAAKDALMEWDAGDDAEELAALESFIEAEGYGDFAHGKTCIRDSYFEDYARELADDIGAIPKGVSWPNTCIDWEQAARELQYDYTSAELDGETYWFRS